jgi:hypothetical protein
MVCERKSNLVTGERGKVDSNGSRVLSSIRVVAARHGILDGFSMLSMEL